MGSVSKRLIAGIIVLAALIWGSVAQGEMFGSELGAFYTYLDAEDIDAGHGLGAKLKLNLAEILSAEGRVSYMRFGDEDIEMVPLEAAVMVVLPLGNFLPYAGIGAGYYIFNEGDIDLDDEVGYFPLVGLQFNLGDDIGLFAEGRWLYLETDSDDVKGDADVSGFGLNIGVSLLF